MSQWICRLFIVALAVVGAASPAAVRGEVIEHRLPVADGRVAAQKLLETVGASIGLPKAASAPAHAIDLSGDRGATFCRQLSATLAPACQASLDATALTVRLDRKAAPTDPITLARAARLFTAGVVTRPAAAGEKYCLSLPAKLDVAKPLVVLIHGIDSGNDVWGSMAATLAADGHQVAYFSFDDDAPLANAGDLLADCFADLRLNYPALKVHVIAHSMGGLVARHFIEGPAYRGGIDRFILIATPNRGSCWAKMRWALLAYQRLHEGKQDEEVWARICKDGNGPAARDMLPGSQFLQLLNRRPRAKDVRYTVIAGNQSTVRNMAAGWVDGAAGVVPEGAKNWWGLKQAREALERKSQAMREQPAECDGPVTVESCKLDHVADFLVIHADHMGLACGHPPAAWAAIKERLGK